MLRNGLTVYRAGGAERNHEIGPVAARVDFAPAGCHNGPMGRIAHIIFIAVFAAAAAEPDPQKGFEELFGDRVRQAESTPATGDDIALAEELLASLETLAGMPALQTLACRKALSLAMKDTAGYGTAESAAKQLLKRAPEHGAAWKEQLAKIQQLRFARARGKKKAAAGQALLDLLTAAAGGRAAAGETEQALTLYRRALIVAGQIRSDRTRALRAKIEKARNDLAVERSIRALRKKLEAAPADAAARAALITALVTRADDPAAAAKLLDDTVDETLRTFVPLAARDSATIKPADRVQLGAWYRELSSGLPVTARLNMLKRAADCYESFLAGHEQKDVARLRAAVTLKSIEDDIERLGGSRAIDAVLHWNMADDADVYHNGRPLRRYRPDFRTRGDEAWKVFSAQVRLKRGDVFTVGGRRGGSYGFVLFALDGDGKTVWMTDEEHWQVYQPADTANWQKPSVALTSPKKPVTVKPVAWRVGDTLRKKHDSPAKSIWDTPGTRTCYLVGVVE